MLFRQDINCILQSKIALENASYTNKIFTFAPSVVNQLTMYIYTNQLIIKQSKDVKH
jgi:hypothetical protein